MILNSTDFNYADAPLILTHYAENAFLAVKPPINSLNFLAQGWSEWLQVEIEDEFCFWIQDKPSFLHFDHRDALNP